MLKQAYYRKISWENYETHLLKLPLEMKKYAVAETSSTHKKVIAKNLITTITFARDLKKKIFSSLESVSHTTSSETIFSVIFYFIRSF